MSFYSVCGLTLARAIAAGIIAAPVCARLEQFVNNSGGRCRTLLFIAMMMPWFAPELLVGYAWSSFSLSLLHREVANHGFYFALVVLKSVPVGLLVLQFAPASPVSAAGIHSHRLLKDRDWFRQWNLRLRGPGLRTLTAAGGVTLLAFQEFEIASIMSVPAWTVTLFDLHAQGIQPGRMLTLLTIPLLIELAIVTPLTRLWVIQKGVQSEHPASERAKQGTRSVAVLWSLTALILLWVIPLYLVIRSGAGGIQAFLNNAPVVSSFLREVRDALLLSGTAALAAIGVATLMQQTLQRSRRALWALAIPLLPGLCGALTVSVTVMLSLQWPPLAGLRSSTLPALLALVLFLLPRAVLLLGLFAAIRPRTSLHLAGLLETAQDPARRKHGARLRWQLDHRTAFWTFALLFYWGYMNLTVTDLVRPAWIVPVPVRLYNLMHYGQNGPLSVMTLLSVLIPLLLLACLAAVLPWASGRVHLLARTSPHLRRSGLSVKSDA